MPIGPDILASALQHLAPKYSETCFRGIPLFSYMLGRETGPGASGGKISKIMLQGPYFEFNVVTGDPGQITPIRDSTEMLHSQQNQTMVRGNEFSFMSIYHYAVPIRDLMMADGEQDLGRIIKSYPELAVAGYKQRMSKQLARGAGSSGATGQFVDSGTDGLFTLNGSQTYNPNGTARTGLFQWAAPASQTATVHGLAMQGATSGTTGWYHQYAHINSFSTDGMRKWRTLVQTANQEGLMLEPGGIDLVCCDQATFQNFLENLDEKVTAIDSTTYPLAKYLNRQGYRLEDGSDIYYDPDIDITDTTSFSNANAQLGVAYLLNTRHWELLVHGQNSKIAGNGLFDMRDYIPDPHQPVIQYRIVSNFNLACLSLRNQGALTGGAQE